MTDNSKKLLIKNTFFLYIMTFSSQVLGLITIPYQTRVLSPEMYGAVGVAISVMTFMSLVLDFGILLSATSKVARHADDIDYVSRLYSNVFALKVGIALICGCCLAVLCLSSSYYRSHFTLYTLYYFAYVFAAMLPDYLYRGFEQMKVITLRTVAIRAFSTACTFVFLHSDADVLALPLCLLFGNVMALAVCLRYNRRVFSVRLVRPTITGLKELVSNSLPFFFSRISSTIYSTANPIVLNLFFAGKPIIGLYTASEKFLSVSKSIVSPIADSLYPYMIKTNDFKTIKRILLFSIPFILIGAALAYTFAEPICGFVFGSNYRDAGAIVRCLIPAITVIIPSYIICFPVLTPLGLSSKANFSNFIGLCIQIISLIILIIFNKLNVYTVCLATSAAEVSVFAYRVYAVMSYRKPRGRHFVRVRHTEK